jgi:hypothetical protein
VALFGGNRGTIRLEKEVDEIDFTLLLVGSGMEFQEIGDAEKVAELVEALGVERYLRPLTEGFTSIVGVGEDHYFVIDQGGEEFGLEHLEAATG